MGVAVPFAVSEAALCLWNRPVEIEEHVVHDVRVGVLINRDGGCGVRAVDHAEAVLDAAVTYGPAHLIGHLNKLVALRGSDFEALHKLSPKFPPLRGEYLTARLSVVPSLPQLRRPICNAKLLVVRSHWF